MRPPDRTAPRHASPSRYAARGVVVVALLLVANYAPVLASLWHQWISNDVHSHGLLIPAISAYLAWLRRDRWLRQDSPRRFACHHAALLGLSLVALLVGRRAGLLLLEELSLVGAVAGTVLCLLGPRSFRVLLLPLSYLVFMVPVWESLSGPLQLPIQTMSSEIGARLMSVVGVPVYQDGVLIELPNVTLEVAEVCSGVGNLIAVIALGIPLALIYLDTWPKRLGLLGFALAVAALSNAVRVAVIGALWYYGVTRELHGPGHVLQGLLVAAVGYVVLGAGVWVLGRRPSRPRRFDAREDYSPGGRPHTVPSRWSVVVASLLLLTSLGLRAADAPVPLPPRQPLKEVPVVAAGWRCAPARVAGEWRAVGADEELGRRCVNGSGHHVLLYVGYFAYQVQGKELVTYRTRTLERRSVPERVTLASGEAIPIRQYRSTESGRDQLVSFFYYASGSLSTDRLSVKVRSVVDATLHRRTNGAVVVLVQELQRSDAPGRRAEVTTSFLSAFWPLVRLSLPEV